MYLVCQVGEPPDVAEAHRVADTGEDEGDGGAPGLSVLGLAHPVLILLL